jgi:hypothetical protein
MANKRLLGLSSPGGACYLAFRQATGGSGVRARNKVRGRRFIAVIAVVGVQRRPLPRHKAAREDGSAAGPPGSGARV